MSKKANIIIVGGTIAAGKSTLVEMLSAKMAWPSVPELREGDKVQNIILQKLYEGSRIHLATVQYYFITNRYRQYKELASLTNISLLDRGVWEDWIFAKLLMKDDKKSYKHYQVLWKTTIDKIIENFGRPLAYVFVCIDWESFKKRIYSRNREVEVNNFAKNEEYFKNLLDEYNNNFVDLLKESNITPIIIDSSKLTQNQMLEQTINELEKLKII